MALDAGFQSEREERAAFEAFVDATEDDFQSRVPKADARQTRKSAPNPAQAQANADSEDDDFEVEELDDVAEEDTDVDDADADPGDDDDADDSADDGSGEAAISSLEALAEHFQIEPDQVLQNLYVADHDGYELPIGEALDSWREAELSIDTRTKELEESFAQRRDTQTAEIDRQAKGLMTLASAMHRILLSDFSPEALSEAQHNDPVRYGDLVQRKVHMEDMIRQAIAAGEEIGRVRQSDSVADVDALANRELAKLIRIKREWRDPKARSEGMKRAKDYLTKTVKFTADEIESIVDHRILVMVDDAVLGRKVRAGGAKKQVEQIQKRGLRRPSTGLKRSSRRETDNPRNPARAVAMAKLRKSGRAQDAVSLLMEHIED